MAEPVIPRVSLLRPDLAYFERAHISQGSNATLYNVFL